MTTTTVKRKGNDVKKGYKEAEEEPMTKEFMAECLQNIRKCLGVSQKEVSEYLGVNYSAYGLYENGKRKPKYFDSYVESLKEWLMEKTKAQMSGDEYLYAEEFKEDIFHLHRKGKNVIQISTDLDVEEEDVEDILVDAGYTPIEFSMSDLGMT